jgi:hypothetical protein
MKHLLRTNSLMEFWDLVNVSYRALKLGRVSVLLSTRTFRRAGKFRLKPQAKAGQSGPPFNRVRLVYLGRWIVVGVD